MSERGRDCLLMVLVVQKIRMPQRDTLRGLNTAHYELPMDKQAMLIILCGWSIFVHLPIVVERPGCPWSMIPRTHKINHPRFSMHFCPWSANLFSFWTRSPQDAFALGWHYWGFCFALMTLWFVVVILGCKRKYHECVCV